MDKTASRGKIGGTNGAPPFTYTTEGIKQHRRSRGSFLETAAAQSAQRALARILADWPQVCNTPSSWRHSRIMTAERSPRAPERRTPWHTQFTPHRSLALDKAVLALEAAQTAPARAALRRLKAAIEPQPRQAVRP